MLTVFNFHTAVQMDLSKLADTCVCEIYTYTVILMTSYTP